MELFLCLKQAPALWYMKLFTQSWVSAVHVYVHTPTGSCVPSRLTQYLYNIIKVLTKIKPFRASYSIKVLFLVSLSVFFKPATYKKIIALCRYSKIEYKINT